MKAVREDEIVSRTQVNVTAGIKDRLAAAKRDFAQATKEYETVKSKLMAVIRGENILKWSEISDSSDMAVKKMIAGYLIKKVCVYSNYRLHIEFNINFSRFELGLDIPNEYKAKDLA